MLCVMGGLWGAEERVALYCEDVVREGEFCVNGMVLPTFLRESER